MIDSKPTNPKDVIGSGKLPLELVPDTAVAYMALSFLEGALKYGRFNWRVAGVRASIYAAAARRHLNKWWNGENCDPKTKVHHLASVMACCAIVLDAELVGKLTDDRPPRADIGKLIETLEGTVTHLKALFAEHHPHQYTIADSTGAWDGWTPQTKLERAVFGGAPRSVETLTGCKRCDRPFGQPHEPNCHEAYG
jgi:hypothetical protein